MIDSEGEILALLMEVRGDVKSLMSDVVGNGKPGLIRRVTNLEHLIFPAVGAIGFLGAVIGLVAGKLLDML